MEELSAHMRSKRPRTVLAGPYGHPFHAVMVTVPIGAWVSSFVFDVAALLSDDPGVFGRGALWLIGIGIIGALGAAVLGLHDLSLLQRGTKARRTGLVHMALNLVAVALFAVGFFVRLDAVRDQEFSVFAFILSIVALGLIGASGWLGGKLAYHYGVRVADEETQREGFR
ncbi:hypothetical protein NCCP1664_16950 [Zafaria cholistanensis]|uniref:DUF2231 domain-containing protein n=1 Tax=Zafaria cholistanensis TaxID=1682741 RepID=A0A5A7NR56_9MICC|nr:DUF2231 domain-containing protein [Zafaria cholistanensis]GER23199.1 hypothetical protein NCCP1664_16950 [Zafaria cholistanensis]